MSGTINVDAALCRARNDVINEVKKYFTIHFNFVSSGRVLKCCLYYLSLLAGFVAECLEVLKDGVELDVDESLSLGAQNWERKMDFKRISLVFDG